MVQLSGCVKTENETKWKNLSGKKVGEMEIWEYRKRNDVYSIYIIRSDVGPNEK